MPPRQPSAQHVFSLLGPLAYRTGDQWSPVPGVARRRLLALLLLRPNQVLPVEHITGELWGDSSADAAGDRLRAQLWRLRQLLRGIRPAGPAGWAGSAPRLVAHDGGYELAVEPDTLDLTTFTDLAVNGATALRAGEYAAAVGLLQAALGLWRGPALLDVSGPLIRSEADILEGQRLAAVEDCLQARLALGEHRQLLAELRALVARHPMHEGFAGQLMVALTRSGQRAQALTEYLRIRTWLVTELGLEPDEPLQRLHHSLHTDANPPRSRRPTAPVPSA